VHEVWDECCRLNLSPNEFPFSRAQSIGKLGHVPKFLRHFSRSRPHASDSRSSILTFILVRQTRDPDAPDVQYIARSTITLADNTDLDMSPTNLGVGNAGVDFWVSPLLRFLNLCSIQLYPGNKWRNMAYSWTGWRHGYLPLV
jgi:hypothetical protein